MASLISYFNEKRRRIRLKLWWLASAQRWGCCFPDQRVMKLIEMGQKQTSDTWISKQTTCKENVSALFQPRGIKVLLFSILRKMPSVQMGRITPTVAIKYVLTVLSRLIRRNSNIQTNPTGATNTEMSKCCDHKNMWQTSPLPVNSREKEMPRKSDGYQQLVGLWYKRRDLSLTIFSSHGWGQDGARAKMPNPKMATLFQAITQALWH